MTYHPDSPSNAKYWGYLPELKDPRWFAIGRVGGNTTLGIPLMSPDEDGMKLIAFNYWLKDETDVTKSRPVFTVVLYKGGSKTSPVGAKFWKRSKYTYIKRVDNKPGSANGWQRALVNSPKNIPKNTQMWIFVIDYNGTNKETWAHRKVAENPDQNGVGYANPHFLRMRIDNVITESSLFYKHFAINVEYITEEPPEPEPIPEPVPEPTPEPEPDPIPEPIPEPTPEPDPEPEPKTTEERLTYVEMVVKVLRERLTKLENK